MPRTKTTTTVSAKKPATKRAVRSRAVTVGADKKVQAAAPASAVSEPVKAKGFSIPVMDTAGVKSGTMTLPKTLFGAPVNKQLLAQAVRVFLANQREGSAHTKTRGEVEGSTKKIYRQKGTGRARHGAIRAPIFVGGGIVFGPRAHSFKLQMPQSMRRAALASALSSRLADGAVTVMSGLETLEPKTKLMARTLARVSPGKRTLLIVAGDHSTVVRAARNIAGLTVLPARELSVYPVLVASHLIFAKAAISDLETVFT